MASINPNTPVLIGQGQWCGRGQARLGPKEMLKLVTERAGADAGLDAAALTQADLIGVVGFTIDAPGAARIPAPRMADPPAGLAADIGAAPKRAVYTHMGGNSPQQLINWAAERIASGEARLAVIAGAEFLGGLMKTLTSGGDVSIYGGGPDTTPERFGDPRDGCTKEEAAHGLNFPVNVYPMFENAVRAHRRLSIEAHRAAMGRLFAPFSARAAQNPFSWFPTARTAEELVADGPENRMVGFPYPKYLNAIIQVDQAAAVIMCSSAMADELGVAAEKRVYLHGCSEAHELWNPLDRVNYHSAPAIGFCAKKAFDMAGKTTADMAFFDIYSCFPVAVEIACAEIGLKEDDPRGLTLTGGLPYFGGPGNNYSMHGVAEAVMRARAAPGAFGLVTANGWYLTKHAMGIYSTAPFLGEWRREDPKSYQKEIDAQPHPEIVREASGEGVIEAYTVCHGREGYRMGIVIGRDAQGRRFVANTPADAETLKDLESREGVGRKGTVSSEPGGMKNTFTPHR